MSFSEPMASGDPIEKPSTGHPVSSPMQCFSGNVTSLCAPRWCSRVQGSHQGSCHRQLRVTLTPRSSSRPGEEPAVASPSGKLG